MTEKEKILNKFAKDVIKHARRNLTRKGHRASSDLYHSLDYDLDIHKQSFSLQFFMLEYGDYVDQGVRGKKKNQAPKSPFKFRGRSSGGKFEKSIRQWIKTRGIKGRDKKGRFIPEKSLNFLIRRSIINNGLKPSLFFTKPFEAAFKKMPDELVEAYGLDIDEFLEQTVNA